jgi:hypothetical protein
VSASKVTAVVCCHVAIELGYCCTMVHLHEREERLQLSTEQVLSFFLSF